MGSPDEYLARDPVTAMAHELKRLAATRPDHGLEFASEHLTRAKQSYFHVVSVVWRHSATSAGAERLDFAEHEH